MKLIPFVILFSIALFCNSIRDKLQPTPPPPLPVARTPEPAVPDSNEAPSSPNTTKSPPRTVSGGILNEKAKSLPQPPYPPATRAARATGRVSVQVLVDQTGKVVSASAVGGHPLLRAAAVQAARQAEFEPLIINGQAKTFSGVLTYMFQP